MPSHAKSSFRRVHRKRERRNSKLEVSSCLQEMREEEQAKMKENLRYYEDDYDYFQDSLWGRYFQDSFLDYNIFGEEHQCEREIPEVYFL